MPKASPQKRRARREQTHASASHSFWINEFEFGFLELPYPDLNIFFDVPIEIIEKRLNKKRNGKDRKYLNGKTDIHEMDIEYQKKVRENYLNLKNYENFEVVETDDLLPKDVFKKYENKLDRLMLIPKE